MVDLRLSTAVSVTIKTYVCDSQTQTKTNGERVNHAGSMLLNVLTVMQMRVLSYSSLLMAQPAAKVLQRHSQIVTVVSE